MIQGDSLVVMNSLLQYEGMGGKVRMIYMGPPYGVRFGSNFQPLVRKRDVGHGDGEDMTRAPEMTQAYRDAWELGLHSVYAAPSNAGRSFRDPLNRFETSMTHFHHRFFRAQPSSYSLAALSNPHTRC
jgi:hypothetical protein